jgi:hypothetical protein
MHFTWYKSKKSLDILDAIIFSFHCDVQIQILIPQAVGKLVLGYFPLVDEPFSCIIFLVDLDGEVTAFIDEQGLIPASNALSSHEHSSLSPAIVERPKTNRFSLVVITTVSLRYSVLVDQANAYCILASVLDQFYLAWWFNISVNWVFTDYLMNLAIVFGLLHSSIGYLEFEVVQIVLVPKLIALFHLWFNQNLWLHCLLGRNLTMELHSYLVLWFCIMLGAILPGWYFLAAILPMPED